MAPSSCPTNRFARTALAFAKRLRLADGSYQIDFYFADGTRLERHQLVSADGKPLLEQVYRDTGTLKGYTQVDATGKMTITTYFADGKTESLTIVPSTYWGEHHGGLLLP